MSTCFVSSPYTALPRDIYDFLLAKMLEEQNTIPAFSFGLPWLRLWFLQELAHEEVVRSVKLEQAKEVTKLRQEVEQGAKELASKYERKMKVSFTGESTNYTKSSNRPVLLHFCFADSLEHHPMRPTQHPASSTSLVLLPPRQNRYHLAYDLIPIAIAVCGNPLQKSLCALMCC